MHFAERNQSEGLPDETMGGQPAASGPSPRRRWGRWWLGGCTLLALLLVFAPQLVGWSPLRHELPRLRMPGFKGQIRVGSASLSWWGPTILRDLELDAPDGKPFYKATRVIEAPGAFGSVFRRDDPIELQIERPVITLVLRPDGSNVEDALTPVLEHPVKSQRRKTVAARHGSLSATDSVTGRMANWQSISLDTTIDPRGTVSNSVKVSATSTDSDASQPLDCEIKWSNPPNGKIGDVGKWEATVQTTDLPLTALGPLLRRIAADLDLSGSMTCKLHLVSAGDPAVMGSLPAAGDWLVTTQKLQIACPSRMGDERLALDTAEFAGQFTRDAAACRVERLKLTTEVCRVEGSGTIPLNDSSTSTEDKGNSGLPANGDFTLHGDVDLVALAQHLPKTLNIRDGAKLTEGRIKFEAASRAVAGEAQGGAAWAGSIETSRLAALVDGEQVAWDEPLKFKFSLHQEQGRVAVDSVDLQSDVIHLTGRSQGEALHLEAGCDLERVISRLGQFFDTRQQELRGKLSLTADVTRDADGMLAIASRGDAENVLIRHLVTRTVERRAGDLEEPAPGGAPPPAALPAGPRRGPRAGAPPPPLPGRPMTRREMMQERKAAKQAEKQAKREERREERERRKQANEIVLVPVHEWQTLWSEPHLVLTCRSRVHHDPVSVELQELGAETDGLKLHAQGSIGEILSRFVVDLSGQADYDSERLIERVRDLVGPHLQVVGKDSRRFSVKGPLRSPASPAAERPLVPLELAANAGWSWQRGDLFGVEAGPGSIDLTLAQGIVSMKPLEMAVSGGRLKASPRIVLTGRPALVEIPAGLVLDRVELTDEMCDAWLMYIAPVVAQATRTEGRVSLALDESKLPLADLAGGEMTGHVLIEGHVLPGPVIDEISRFIGGIIAGIDGGPLSDWLAVGRPLVEIGRQEVEFELHDRRLYHNRMEFIARGIVIQTRGSVGLDESLDMVAAISLTDEAVSRLRLPVNLQGRPLEIPIQGTLRKPRLARGAVGSLVEQLGQSILERIFDPNR